MNDASEILSRVKVEHIIQAAREAGAEILEVYGREFEIETKEDHSPLTEADKRGNAVILRHLALHYPAIPLISEETKAVAYEERKGWDSLWLIDPLDGTKEFIKRNGEFTVNIALVHKGVPVLGVVYRPVDGTLYYGLEGEGSFRIDADGTKRSLRGGPHYSETDDVIVVASRSHLTQEVEDFVGKLRAEGKKVQFLSAGSSLKLCLVAEGKATVYPRFGPTMEWDTGAAHAVAMYAGKNVINCETGEPLIYNKENLLNPWFIVE